MNDPEHEIVRIGVSGPRILGVTHQRIEYIDMAGQAQFVDLESCAKTWGRRRDDRSHEFVPLFGATEQSANVWSSQCVGQRCASDNPPWAEFMNERKTRFEFATDKDLYRELLTPLKHAGWHTFDTD